MEKLHFCQPFIFLKEFYWTVMFCILVGWVNNRTFVRKGKNIYKIHDLMLFYWFEVELSLTLGNKVHYFKNCYRAHFDSRRVLLNFCSWQFNYSIDLWWSQFYYVEEFCWSLDILFIIFSLSYSRVGSFLTLGH